MIPALVVLTLAQLDGGMDVVSSASVKATLDADVGIDMLAANVVNTGVGAGIPGANDGQLTAFELGLRARAYATAVDRHIHFDLDYMGRQPFASGNPDTPIHLLYKTELSIDVLDKLLFIGVGRFLAPATGLLAVDGARVVLHFSRVDLQLFGGRRAITSTDASNVDFSTFLPAAGAAFNLNLSRVQAELAASYSKDQVPFAAQSIDAFQAYARATGRPFDWLVLGAEVATAQRASYVIGPTWNDVAAQARTVDLFYVYGFIDLRPLKALRFSYDFHFQQAQLFREAPNDPALDFVPQYMDNRLRIRVRPLGLGWVTPQVRVRVRPDRDEVRAGIDADLAPDWAYGFCLRGGFTYEKMVQTNPAIDPTSDRSYWSASVGWRGRGFDVAVGASDVERSVLPIGSRVYTGVTDLPNQSVDLSPFVLQAERIAFARVFWGSSVWFAGLDFEQSLNDARERRFFAQIGARLEQQW
jgi:hypothetical protein